MPPSKVKRISERSNPAKKPRKEKSESIFEKYTSAGNLIATKTSAPGLSNKEEFEFSEPSSAMDFNLDLSSRNCAMLDTRRIHDEFEKLNQLYQNYLNQQIQQGVILFESATARNNYHKNRYNNILATESTRVHLANYRDLFLDSDYINANYIDGEIPTAKRGYVACQAPLSNTIVHFWLMIWVRECQPPKDMHTHTQTDLRVFHIFLAIGKPVPCGSNAYPPLWARQSQSHFILAR